MVYFSERTRATDEDARTKTKKAFRTSDASSLSCARARVVRPDAEFGAEKCVPRRRCARDDAPASTSVSCARLRSPRSRSPPSPEPVRTSPADSKFTQQELPAWRPTLTPAWVRLPRAPTTAPQPRPSRARGAPSPSRARAKTSGRRRFVLPPKQARRVSFPSHRRRVRRRRRRERRRRAYYRRLTHRRIPTRHAFADVRDPIPGGVRVRAPGRGVLRREPKRGGGGRALRRRVFRRVLRE